MCRAFYVIVTYGYEEVHPLSAKRLAIMSTGLTRDYARIYSFGQFIRELFLNNEVTIEVATWGLEPYEHWNLI